jgi:hypothetical protein
MEYSVTVWRTPVRESKEVLFRLTYRKEWMSERNLWRHTLVRQQSESEYLLVHPVYN